MRRGPLGIGLLAAVLLASSAGADEAQEAAAASLALNPLAALDKATLDGFRDAPLFTPSRSRPAPPPPERVVEAPPPPEPVEEPPPDPPTIKLAGVVEGPEGAVAVVTNGDGEDKVERVRLGDQIEGWLVTTIDAQSLKLTLDDQEQEYRLFQRSEKDEAGAGTEDDDASSSDESETSSSDDDDAAAEAAAARRRQQQIRQRPPASQMQQRRLGDARQRQRQMRGQDENP